MYKEIISNVVDEQILEHFDMEKQYGCTTLFEYAIRNSKIDEIISIAKLFSPDFVSVKDYIFIKSFWNYDENNSLDAITELEQMFNYNKKLIEMHVNSWSLGDFFLGCDDAIMDDEKVLTQFGHILEYYWRRRIKEVFPEKNMKIEIGNSIMGEYGLTITMFEEK